MDLFVLIVTGWTALMVGAVLFVRGATRKPSNPSKVTS